VAGPITRLRPTRSYTRLWDATSAIQAWLESRPAALASLLE